jgi:hypothetical protein
MKLTAVMKSRKNSRNCKRFYTAVDMACIKHDAAVQNSQVKRGEVKRTNTQFIMYCSCGVEGCFIHASKESTVHPPVQASSQF